MNITDNRILWLVPIIGIIVSSIISFTSFRYELEKEQNKFIATSNLLFNNVVVSFDELENVNEHITLLFNSTDVISEDQFKLFSKPTLSRYPFIDSIFYSPRVSKINIISLEQNKQNEGYTNFHFKPFPKKLYSPSPVNQFLFPIDYIQPFNVSNSTLIGRDILTFKAVQNEILQSTKMGNSLVFSPGDNIFYAFSSLYFGKETPHSYDMNVDNVYAILGYKVSISKLLEYIALPELFNLGIYINDVNTIPEIKSNNNYFFNTQHKINRIHEINSQRIEIRLQHTRSITEHDFTLPIFILVSGFLLTFLSWYVLRSKIQINRFLHQQNKTIEAEVNEKTELLNQKTVKLKLAYEDQVNATNELKSFSYSISHDLRAPLRSIDGFCKMLDEDYSDRLDDTGRDYIHRVRTSAQHMGELITCMLNLALVSHKDINQEKVSLSLFAINIISILKSTNPERIVEVHIADDITVTGDSILLNSVLKNLLTNAWKFTEHTNNARIEFNKEINNNEVTYFIKDNGIGFDMAHVNKIFIPFQRLHNTLYNGTGIGLATVERIIKRHRGKISAVAKLNEGAKFSFTINNIEN